MQQQQSEDLRVLLDVLPQRIREKIEATGQEDSLLEVVMDLGRIPTARYVDGEHDLSNSEITQTEIDQVVDNIGDFDDDNRAGMARTLHRISGIRNRRGQVVGLTCRVGRAVHGTIDIISDLIGEGQSILLLGRPGVGKTTMLREMARILSEQKRVVIVDTSNEIGGDGDIPHPAVGRARRMQVPRPSQQHETMIEAVENHNPEVIIIDEIGRELEAAAARTINERGVQLIGTAHGNSLENLLLNPTLSDLVGGIESVTLSDEEARRRGTQKTVLERRAPPTFDLLVEIQDRQRLVVHQDVASAVDGMLRGEPLDIELRQRDEAGEVDVSYEKMMLSSSAVTGRRDGRTRREAREARNSGGHDGRHSRQSQANGHRSRDRRRSSNAPVLISQDETETTNLHVFAYGVARNRLHQAAKQLGVKIYIVDDVEAADVFVTLKSYYRKRRRLIKDAERQQTPVYVLRANTVPQMERFLAQALNLSYSASDPFDSAIAEAEKAVELINSGQSTVSLAPVSAGIRRHQHQIARQANLVSHSYGKEPYRHVRIFGTKRNES